MQAGFPDYAINDKKVKAAMQATLQQPRSRLLNDSIQTALWALSIDQPARFAKPMPFSRTIDREMTDGSFMKFTWNQSDQWQQVAFTISNSFSNVYWLDASEGVISRASKTDNVYVTMLPPYGTIILYASKSNSAAWYQQQLIAAITQSSC